jgi:HEAT repeat protein
MAIDSNRIKSELAKVGVSINSVYDLVNTNQPYPSAVPVLLNLLKVGIEDVGTREGVIRALAVKEAVGKASSILLAEYDKVPRSQMMLRWAIGNTIYTTITEADVESIVPIVMDKENGISRQMFVAALGKVKSAKAEDVLITLLDDDDVASHSLEALGRIKSSKAKDKIAALTTHPRALIRREALKALKKIE